MTYGIASRLERYAGERSGCAVVPAEATLHGPNAMGLDSSIEERDKGRGEGEQHRGWRSLMSGVMMDDTSLL